MTEMPTVGDYRGVRLHALQSEHRIVTVVKPSIDKVYSTSDVGELIAYLKCAAHPPEARLCAGARVKAINDVALTRRTSRPDVGLEWASLDQYASDLDPDSGAAPRPAEFQNQLDDYCRGAAGHLIDTAVA